jgi:hypothetical protein
MLYTPKKLYALKKACTTWEETRINSFDFVIIYFNQYAFKHNYT